MAEADEQVVETPPAPETTEPVAPEQPPAPAEPAPEQPAPEQPEQPEQPGDISDAIAELKALRQGFERRGMEFGEPAEPPQLDRFYGRVEPDEYDEYGPYEDEGEPEQQQPQQLTEEQQYQQQVREMMREVVQEEVGPMQFKYEMERRKDAFDQFQQQNPQALKGDVLERMDAHIAVMDPNFGRVEGYIPWRGHIERAYLLAQAEIAGIGKETSQGAAAPSQDAAEAAGQQGTVLETGAGPGVATPEMDPQEKLYLESLTSGNDLGYDGLGGQRS